MKKMVFLIMLFFPTISYGQCIANITDVSQDENFGSIVVSTAYYLNGEFIQNGKTRYLETSGDNDEIIKKAKEDISTHCDTLIRKIPKNESFINEEILKTQKEITSPIINQIKNNLVGYSITKTDLTTKFKGKEIKVTYDSKNISNITP